MKTIVAQDSKIIINADCIAAVRIKTCNGRVNIVHFIRVLDKLSETDDGLVLAKFLCEEQAIETLARINDWLIDVTNHQCFHIPEDSSARQIENS